MEHQPHIAAYAKRSAENFGKVAIFALVSAQTPFLRLWKVVGPILDGRDDGTRLSSMKRQGVAFWRSDEGRKVYKALYELKEAKPYSFDLEGMKLLTATPALGLVKSGFVMQLAFGRLGCIDTHNMKTYFPSQPVCFRSPKRLREKTKERAIASYIETVQRLGCPQVLWDRWCELMACKYATTPDYISQLHCDILGV